MSSEMDPVIQLGKSLADALDASDIVGRWVAHHLADLITRSKAQPADHELARETREVILKLWEHKAGGQFKETPLAYVKPVLGALARLEPDPPPWAYFRTLPAEATPQAHDLALYPVLEAACDADREFGRLVRLAVTIAAQEAIDREAPWVIAATKVGGSEVDDVLQRLQKMISGYRVDTALYQVPAQLDDPFDPDSVVADPTESPSAGKNEQPNSDGDVLTVALKEAITRCMKLLERLNGLVAEPDLTDAPMTPEAANDPSEAEA